MEELSQDQKTHLTGLEKTLNELLARKKQAEKHLCSIEFSLFSYETSYLEEGTCNIVNGYESMLGQPLVPGPILKKRKVPESERIFSGSSLTYVKSVQAKLKEIHGATSFKKKRSNSGNE